MYKSRQAKSSSSHKKVTQGRRKTTTIGWDEAIAEAKRKIATLQNAVRAFEEWRDSGEPFPGKSAVQHEQEVR